MFGKVNLAQDVCIRLLLLCWSLLTYLKPLSHDKMLTNYDERQINFVILGATTPLGHFWARDSQIFRRFAKCLHVLSWLGLLAARTGLLSAEVWFAGAKPKPSW